MHATRHAVPLFSGNGKKSRFRPLLEVMQPAQKRISFQEGWRQAFIDSPPSRTLPFPTLFRFLRSDSNFNDLPAKS
jgi:hypothetical protein